MNKYDEVYEIRQANKNDIDQIMIFIDECWKKGHILAKDKKFFEYEFLEENGNVNFWIAIKKDTQRLEGIQGFLKASYHNDNSDIWGCLCRVKEGNMILLGAELVKRMYTMPWVRYCIGIGLNPKTAVPIMKRCFGNVISKMKQYYFLGKNTDYKIAKISYIPSRNMKLIQAKNVEIQQVKSIEDLIHEFKFEKYKNNVPFKDAGYYDKRFFKHPKYLYNIYGIYEKENMEAFFITREESVENKKVLRIVDYMGKQKEFAKLYNFFSDLVQKVDYEYIDFYCEGFREEYIFAAGFILRKEDDDNIIPNYFHPFVQKNIEIYTSSPAEKTVFLKADGDQDRPN